MRLDCVESNQRLRDFCRAQGYSEVGRRDFDGPWFSATLFEKALDVTSIQRGVKAPHAASCFASRDARQIPMPRR